MITLGQLKHAEKRIVGIAYRTPLVPYLRSDQDMPLLFKTENLQPIGVFKLRGAYNKIASLSEENRRRGVVTFSSGNHAQGVAYAARALGVAATIVMPSTAPRVKISRTESLGANIILLEGGGENHWKAKADELASKHGYSMVHPFEDDAVIAGQGTIGLEITEDCKDVATVLVPIGGGGLISGIAAAVKMTCPGASVIGVEPELAANAQASLRSGRIEEWPHEDTRRTMADGLTIPRVGDVAFTYIEEFVDDILTVSENEIEAAMRELMVDAHMVAEPSGAVTFAAYLFHRNELARRGTCVAVISGGNADAQTLARVLAQPS